MARAARPINLTSAAWYTLLADSARSIGSGKFHQYLLNIFAAAIRHDMALVVRYSRLGAPDFLVCEGGFQRHIIDLYLSGYYRFDPFYSHWRDKGRAGVVSLRDVAQPGLGKSDYRRIFQRQAQVADELGLFLPGIGGASLSLFLERSKGRFTAAEIARARLLYPLIAGLYKAHIGRVFADLSANPALERAQQSRATLFLDRAGARVFADRAWRRLETTSKDVAPAARSLAAGNLVAGKERRLALSGNWVMHAERLDADFPLAPGGRMLILEQAGLAPAGQPDIAELAPFAQLTARERDIVRLILAGHPTALIARKLKLGTGTVKNHRRRLYYKLDITSERELFLFYLSALGAGKTI